MQTQDIVQIICERKFAWEMEREGIEKSLDKNAIEHETFCDETLEEEEELRAQLLVVNSKLSELDTLLSIIEEKRQKAMNKAAEKINSGPEEEDM